jgi:alkylation response protein AidB-like acyl-CoA dehydrogenase
MKTGNYFLDNRDLVLTFDRLAPWDRLVPLTEGAGADVAETVATWREVLVLAGKYVGNEVASRAKEIDELGVIRDGGRVEISAPLKQNIKGLAELGLIGLSFPREHDGAGLPFTMSAFLIEMLSRACPTTMVQYGIAYTSPGAMILRFGSDEQKREYLPRLASGAINGAVAMTEPQAGSDVGKVATAAVKTADCWRLNGRKQFISAGNGDFVIVLARSVPGSAGLEGLSLFIAERANDNYVVDRAEHKFTIRGSPTCALSFDGTKAELLGEVGAGWREITSFMNEARVAIGIQGLGTAQAAYEAAADYAAQRVQMDRPIREHPLVAEMLLEMETSIEGLRALVLEAALRQDLSFLGKDERAAREVRELTPLVKWYGAEETIRVCRLALQIFGGYGVVTEYEVERYMRDALILPIYEGTSQIQSLMAVKDLMKTVLRRPATLLGAGPSLLLASASFEGRAGRDFAAARGLAVGSLRGLALGLARRGGIGALRGTKELDDEDLAPFLLHAERITETLAHVHVARALLLQAGRVPEKAAVAARAARRARLIAERNARRIESGDLGVFARIEAWRRERKA